MIEWMQKPLTGKGEDETLWSSDGAGNGDSIFTIMLFNAVTR
jgi:hypothetical protein